MKPASLACLFVLGVATLNTLTGCSWIGSGSNDKQPAVADSGVRALWITRFDYRTQDDIVTIMENAAAAGFNTVLFQVRGNGTVAYPSRYEPWSRQFEYRHPGFDPLRLAVTEAHKRSLRLEAWVNVMPAWRGPGEPPMRNQLYHAHPDWFWYDAQGTRQPYHHEFDGKSRDWYVSINPCLPEVRDYLTKVFAEIVGHYPVDGLHMDYIRFPNERVVAGETIPDYPHDQRTLALFRAATGSTPQQDPDGWNRWRSDQVTALVGQIHAMMRKTRRKARLSAAVGSVPARALTHFQDSRTWIERGIIDEIFLMNYTSSPDKFAERIDPWLQFKSQVPLIPGLWVQDKPDVQGGARAAAREIEIARTTTGNFCFFAYASLFDSRDDEELTRQNDASSTKRMVRRSIIVPAVKGRSATAQRAQTASHEGSP